MAVAAVPGYLGKDYSSASPGDRFTMFLPVWMSAEAQQAAVQAKAAKKSREGFELKDAIAAHGLPAVTSELADRGKIAGIWQKNDSADAIKNAFRQVLSLNADDQARMAAIATRQLALNSTDAFVLDALSTAPFATGLGIEHPLENGFAFLNPYGLPYLPGSGVKGVLRKAAQELQQGLFGGTAGWTADAITALFGLEGEDHDTTHQRGVLTFWDVIPQIKGNQLAVEIMTPHQSHYLQGKDNPHDSGSPNPISFLAVPAGSNFTFHIECDRRRLKLLAAELVAQQPADDPWRALIRDACTHAFEWLGFGAKTTVGYGAMEAVGERERRAEEHKQAEQAAYEAQAAAELTNRLTTWQNVEVTYDKGSGKFSARSPDNTVGAIAQGDDAKKLREAIGEAQLKRFKKKGKLRLTIEVDVEGNRAVIHAIHSPAA